MKMSEKIKLLRKERNMTLEDVGNAVGVGKSTVRKWETGMIANIRIDKIGPLAKTLGTTTAHLMGFEDFLPNNAIKGNNNTLEGENTETCSLTEAEQTLLDMYNQMNIIKRSKLIVYASELLKEP